MTPDAAVALAALLSLVFALVAGTVKGVRHAVAVERRYARSMHDRPRQDRRCPYCTGWFNSSELQAAHERDCDQKPAGAE